MLPFNQNPPRIKASIDNPVQDAVNYQFCFLNRPFVAEDNPKDVYYKLLIWPKAETIITNFSFLIKINNQGTLKPLELLEFPKLGDGLFDPFGDQHLTVKIPQNFYQSKLQFAFSYSAFNYENHGQISLDLNWFDSHQIDNVLIFYDQKAQQSTNLLTWDLETSVPQITFNNPYPKLLTLTTNLIDLTSEISSYESIKQLRFLALLDEQKPELKNLNISSLAAKKPYDFEPRVDWKICENLSQKMYSLQLNNQLDLIGEQIKEVGRGDIGFQANPFVANTQVLSLNFTFLNQEYNVPIQIKQASIHSLDNWEGDYFEV